MWLAEGVVKGNFRIDSYRFDLIKDLLAGKARLRCGEPIGRMVGSRLSQPRDAHADLFASVTDKTNLDSEKPLPQPGIFQEAVSCIPAGADISSAATCATFFYRVIKPLIKDKRLMNEVRSTFTSNTDNSGMLKLL